MWNLLLVLTCKRDLSLSLSLSLLHKHTHTDSEQDVNKFVSEPDRTEESGGSLCRSERENKGGERSALKGFPQ